MKKENKYRVDSYDFKKSNTKIETIFPTPLRCLIVGPSDSGKTTLLCNIVQKRWVTYKYLYIFTKSINQSVYDYLQELFSDIDTVETFISDKDIIPVDECNLNSLVVFDDCMLENQRVIKEYFVRSRHTNISCIYLAQNYLLTDLQTIRVNLNCLIVFEQLEYYMKKLWSDFFSSFRTLSEFKSLCIGCWKNRYGFLALDIKNKCLYKKLDNCYIERID